MAKFKLEVVLSPDEVQRALVAAALSKVDLGVPYKTEDSKADLIDRGAIITLEVG